MRVFKTRDRDRSYDNWVYITTDDMSKGIPSDMKPPMIDLNESDINDLLHEFIEITDPKELVLYLL